MPFLVSPNHIAQTPLDEAFSAVAWAKATA